MARRLTRNMRRSVIGGVAAGLGDHLDIDPVLIRLAFITLCLAGGSGLLLYIVCWLVMPRDDEQEASARAPGQQFADEVREAGGRVMDGIRRTTAEPGRARLIGGLFLILLGALLLMDQFLPLHWLRFRYLWPLVLIGIGVALLVKSRKEDAP
ncbi:MAG: PspC domain-containing protein [Acidobacteriota bacterium]